MFSKIMGIEKKSEEIKGEKEIEEDPKGKEVSCSICLEVVIFGGDRSTAKLQCGHEFHLDCIGSAFNAKGSMQCPNCRKIEKGNWIYANKPSRNPTIPDLNMMDEYNHDEDLYDLSYSEMPLGVHWCPFGRVPQFSSFFEEGESSPPLTFSEIFNQQAAMYPSLLPHLHNQNHPHHHPLERTVLGQPLSQPLQQIPAPTDFNYHSWGPFQYNGPNVGMQFNNGPNLGRSGGGNNGPSLENEGQGRGANHLFDFLGNSSRSRNPTSLVPPLIPQFMRSEASMHDQSTPNMFQRRTNNMGPTPTPAQPESTTPFCLFPPTSSNSNNIASEDGGGNRFYAWERDRFAPYPLIPVETGENGWWGQGSESEQRRGFWQQPRNRSDGSSYRGPRMQSFM